MGQEQIDVLIAGYLSRDAALEDYEAVLRPERLFRAQPW